MPPTVDERRDCTREQAAHALLCQRHQRKQLAAVLDTLPATATPRTLLIAARNACLDPTLAECRALLREVRPGHPEDAGRVKGQAEAVLAAARTLPQPFTLEELVLACWQARPDLFGMDGYEGYPDSHRTRCALYGPRGLLGQGRLVREGVKRYRVV